jgi:hypothetical protein
MIMAEGKSRRTATGSSTKSGTAKGAAKTGTAAKSRSATARTLSNSTPDADDPHESVKPSHVLPSASTMAAAEQILSGLASLAPNRMTGRLRSMADRMMNWAGTAAEVAVGATAPLIKEPTRRSALEKAGSVLRDARETAGLTADDVAAALDFKDTNLLELAESGRIALPFEVILRLASLLARNDPIPFVMNLTRIYNPGLWKIIEQLGIGRVALHVAREHEFINIFRSRDAARHMSDEEFKIVVKFTDSAFAMALEMAELKRPQKVKAKAAE